MYSTAEHTGSVRGTRLNCLARRAGLLRTISGMPHRPNREEWLRQLHESQRNIVFPDTARNYGGFWRGIRDQKLNGLQCVSLLILVAFQVSAFAITVLIQWPKGSGSVWDKFWYSYGLNLLIFSPVIVLFLLFRWSVRRAKRDVPSQRSHPRRGSFNHSSRAAESFEPPLPPLDRSGPHGNRMHVCSRSPLA